MKIKFQVEKGRVFILIPPLTEREWRDRLRWRKYKAKAGLMDFGGGFRCNCHLALIERGERK